MLDGNPRMPRLGRSLEENLVPYGAKLLANVFAELGVQARNVYGIFL